MSKPRVNGVLFPPRGNGPMKGHVEIDGIKTPIVAWENKSQKGDTYYQIREDKPQPGFRQGPKVTLTPINKWPAPGGPMDDDDIPF